MNKLKKIIASAAFAMFAVAPAFAQGGSNYSMYGIGDIHNNLSARYEGMGGVSIAVPSEYGINLKNPAMWSFVETTRIQAGYHYNQRRAEYGDDLIDQSNAGVNQILGLFAIDSARGIAVSFGVLPYSSINYYIQKNDQYIDDQFDFYGESIYTGSGGITEGYIGLSSEITNNFRLGLQADIFFGTMSQATRTLFYDGINQEQTNDRDDQVSGSGLKFGFSYEPVKNLFVGAYYEKILKLNIDSKISYDGQLNSVTNDSTYTRKYELDLPDSYGVGIALKTGKFLIAADYSCQDFSNFKNEANSLAEFKNSQTLAVGLSRFGSKSYRADFFDKITYNFGLGYKQLYYSVKGEDINEIFASVGFDWNTVGSMMVNLAFTGGIRGKNSDGLLKETFLRMNVNISLGETWFKPFKPDY